MKKYFVYKITNLINGKYYIGVHKGTKYDGYLGSGKLIKKAISKYGVENFNKEILFEFNTKDEAYSKEKELVVSEGWSHYDIYDKPEPVKIALDKLIPFYKKHLG